eukprot:TRINITY_DN32399_c0_g2_i2.p2 TRINITY_DN32399_c0_g2~~TRINITY_DN32399_c0_g2_i2.p2  ORF type:complete len:243 (-),score=17.85 TRINITY_DN32399_c0_g2_i2:176-904(-)
MLRISFQCRNEEVANKCLQGLNVIAKQNNNQGGFILYNQRSDTAGLMMEMVEVHNDPDCVWITSIDQVLSSIRQVPGIDQQMEALKLASKPQVPKYPQLFGRVFSGVPSALSYVLRASCPEMAAESQPVAARINVSYLSKSVEVLDLLQKLCDQSQSVVGSISCLSTRVDPKLHYIPQIIQAFLGYHQFISFYQDPQTIQILKLFQNSNYGQLEVEIYGDLGNYGKQVAETLKQYVQVTLRE